MIENQTFFEQVAVRNNENRGGRILNCLSLNAFEDNTRKVRSLEVPGRRSLMDTNSVYASSGRGKRIAKGLFIETPITLGKLCLSAVPWTIGSILGGIGFLLTEQERIIIPTALTVAFVSLISVGLATLFPFLTVPTSIIGAAQIAVIGGPIVAAASKIISLVGEGFYYLAEPFGDILDRIWYGN